MLFVTALERLSLLVERAGRVLFFAAVGMTPMVRMRARMNRRWSEFYAGAPQIASGWMRWEEALIDRFVRPGDRIMVVGCGSGRDVIPFAARGHRVSGIDSVEPAVARAREALGERGLTASLTAAFVEDIEFEGEFDVFWFSWFTYGYIVGARQRIEILRNVCRHLAPGGRVIVSYLEADTPPHTRAAAAGRFMSQLVGNDWTLEPGDVVHRQTGADDYGFEHWFRPGEIRQETGAAGLRHVFYTRFPTAIVAVRDSDASDPAGAV